MLVSINENDSTPIYLQIVRQIKEQILVGELCDGDELPSVRDLGDALKISHHTARSAYQALSDAGLLRVRLGRKARIAAEFAERAAVGPRGENSAAAAVLAREIVVDAMLAGLTRQMIHALIDREIDALDERRAEAGNIES